MNDPVQIDASRRVLAGTVFSASTRDGSIGRPTSASPPPTRTVCADSTPRVRPVTANPVPIDVMTSRPSTDAILSWYCAPNRLASANTSAGPAASSSLTPSKTTITTTRGFGRGADNPPVCCNLCETWPIGQDPVDRQQPQTGSRQSPTQGVIPMSTTSVETIADIVIPDTALVRDVTAFIREAENDLLFDHSRRVFLFGALQGRRRGLKPDLELRSF